MAITKKKTIPFLFSKKHLDYMRKTRSCTFNIMEGAVRSGKTVSNVYMFADALKTTKDKIHLATGSTLANAKLNIGESNNFGLEYIFRGQCHWGKYKSNEALYIKGASTGYKQRIVIFAGGSKADSFKRIRGNSYGMWICTEVNLIHDTFIKEAFNRTIAADNRKIFFDLNPDNPNAPIYKDYIDKYARKNEEGTLLGGYNYIHCTLNDNINISEQRKAEVISQYDKDSIWYQRDILGLRCVAEGLIYRRFASNPKNFIYPHETIDNIIALDVGTDFGGLKSATSFVASAITRGYKEVIVLASERYLEGDNINDLTPDQLGDLFVNFIKKIENKYGKVEHVYADSAEPVLIRHLRVAAEKAGIYTTIRNARKSSINDRINCTVSLMAQGRFYITNDCESLKGALCSAVWDSKKLKLERLDDGSTPIDDLDAMEYSFEANIRHLIDYR